MTRILFVILLLGLFLNGNAQRQKVTFDDVVNIQLQNMGPILEEGQVKGYYLFYKVDKVDRKNNAYLLRIQDENLNEVVKKKMTFPKSTVLTEASYNGTAFMFSFLDIRKKNLQLITYDRQMKKLGTKNIELDRYGAAQYQAYFTPGNNTDESTNKLIFPIKNRGFVRYNMVKNKKYGYELEFVSNDLKSNKSWNKSSPKTSKLIQSANFGDASENYLVSLVMEKPKLLSMKDLKTSINVLDLENKKLAFEKELKGSKYLYSFMNASISENEDKITIFGEFYSLTDNIFKDKSKGLVILQYDISGKLLTEQHHSWDREIKKKIGVDKKGRIEDGGHIAFHKIIETSDGHYYAIGEMYKKAASGIGIASQVLARGNSKVSVAKMVIMDMIAFNFNPDFSINDITVFEKRRNNILLPRGYGHMPPSMLSLFMRMDGGFDYAYTQVTEDNSSFFTTYTSMDKEKGKKRQAYFGVIAKTEGEVDYVIDKIDLSTDATNIRVYPAKPGYVLLTEYFKKKKKLESRLEKINY